MNFRLVALGQEADCCGSRLLPVASFVISDVEISSQLATR
jgi:hypothetical protein